MNHDSLVLTKSNGIVADIQDLALAIFAVTKMK